jgi:hypothetical protein
MRDQRGDDDCGLRKRECRQLVTERLAAARRQHGGDIVPIHDAADNALLQRQKFVVAPEPAQNFVEFGQLTILASPRLRGVPDWRSSMLRIRI